MIASLAAVAVLPTILIRGGTVYDGSGTAGRKLDIRIQGDTIVAVGALKPTPGDKVLNAKGLAVAPGFIDAHSHADVGIKEHPDAESQIRQGITTAAIGQDGEWSGPVKKTLLDIQSQRPAINFASFSGEGGIRERVMGKDFEHAANQLQIRHMGAFVLQDMRDGALGLSTGLEYNPGYYSSTQELIELSKIAGHMEGIYISHVRDETNGQMKAFSEVVEIGNKAKLPVQISHIKLAVASQWSKFADVQNLFTRVNKGTGNHPRLTADVYPYLYWSSTISVLTNSRDWGNRKVWEQALADVGGARNVRLTRYSPNPSWTGKTLAELSQMTGKEPADLIMEIIDKTKDGKGNESVVCTAMREADLKRFIAMPNVMFCTDGSIGGAHPRGAGSFPRILGRYVREQKVLTLQEAIRKSTGLTAWRFGLTDRGRIGKGRKADIVVFNPRTIIDRATPERPTLLSEGMVHVLVNGVITLEDGTMTGKRGGKALFKAVKRLRTSM